MILGKEVPGSRDNLEFVMKGKVFTQRHKTEVQGKCSKICVGEKMHFIVIINYFSGHVELILPSV
jgi:hypothetical protein